MTALSKLRTLLRAVRARYELRGCASVGHAPRVSGKVWIHGDGEIRIGHGVFFDAVNAPIELYSWAGAAIVIGDNSTIEGGSSIEATESIAVGARCRIGPFCKVMDNHFHPLVGDRNVRPAALPVVIEDDVTLGPRSIVLAGAHIVSGSRIEAGSVVKRRAQPFSVAAPAAKSARTTLGLEHRMSVSYLAREIVRIVRLLATDHRAAFGRLARGIGVLRARILFRGCELGELVNALGPVTVIADGKIKLGDRVQLSTGMFASELVCRSGGELSIGARTLLSYGVSIEATESVRIGERCMFGSMVRVRDTGERGSSPVVIGDDVWVAHGAIVEPGVTIGNGSVVGAGSVVRSDVPAHSLAVGNPAISVPLRGSEKIHRRHEALAELQGA
jgi:acetyltransferase-like isoleucine patch superfamily enzyme